MRLKELLRHLSHLLLILLALACDLLAIIILLTIGVEGAGLLIALVLAFDFAVSAYVKWDKGIIEK